MYAIILLLVYSQIWTEIHVVIIEIRKDCRMRYFKLVDYIINYMLLNCTNTLCEINDTWKWKRSISWVYWVSESKLSLFHVKAYFDTPGRLRMVTLIAPVYLYNPEYRGIHMLLRRLNRKNDSKTEDQAQGKTSPTSLNLFYLTLYILPLFV